MSNRDGDFDIYVMDLGGANLTSDRGGTQDIWVISSRGDGARRLTANAADDRNAAWSPDGRVIACAPNRDGDFEIFSMRSNGKDVTQLTDNGATESIPRLAAPDARLAALGRPMASYSVNERGVAHARHLIEARQYVVESDWAEWRHKEIELAAHGLLQLLDRTAA